MTEAYKIQQGVERVGKGNVFSLSPKARTRGHPLKLEASRRFRPSVLPRKQVPETTLLVRVAQATAEAHGKTALEMGRWFCPS